MRARARRLRRRRGTRRGARGSLGVETLSTSHTQPGRPARAPLTRRAPPPPRPRAAPRLLARAKSARSTKLASEKAAQRAFVAAEGFVSATDIAALQTAVNALSKTGSLLAAGELAEAKTTARRAPRARDRRLRACRAGVRPSPRRAHAALTAARARSGAWVAELNRVVKAASPSAEASTVGATLSGAVAALQRAASLGAAKTDYVAAVGALGEWLALSGLSAKVKGV